MFIQNFLSQRDFKCKIGSCLSSTHSQEQGVPQGSVVSCCLFSLAINNMLNVIPPNVKKSLYVDDLLIYSAGTYQVGLERRLQVAINRVQQWALNHGFKFSAAKTTSIIFHRRRRLVPPPQVFLADQPIPSRSCIKYLGMTYDEKLTWKAHINKLKQDCSKHLNLLKCLSHTDWGSDCTTMLRLYRSIIRSKLDYGCFAYATAKSNVLELLDPIHNAAIRLCLGAFRSSPISSLLAESGEPPLSYRRHQLLLQFFARTQQLPTSLTSAYLQQQLPQNDTHSLITGNPVKASLQFINKEELPVLPVQFSETPRWTLPDDVVCDGFDYPKKRHISDIVFRRLFDHHVSDMHTNELHIFTDGSKLEDSVGCSAVCGHRIKSSKLSQYASNYTAELHGLLLAMQLAHSINNRNFRVFTDSRSVLSSITHYDSTHPLISEIQLQIIALQRANKTVRICWCPAHVGIPQNEEADRLAGEAARSPAIPEENAVPYRDHYVGIKSAVRHKWNESWVQITGNKLRAIKNSALQPPPTCANRRLSIILTRLRIGHTHLTHHHLMERRPAPMCQFCQAQTVSVRHLLVLCPALDATRRRCFPLLANTDSDDVRLQRILSGLQGFFNMTAICRYLRELNIFSAI